MHVCDGRLDLGLLKFIHLTKQRECEIEEVSMTAMHDCRRTIASIGLDGRGERPSAGLTPVSESIDQRSKPFGPLAWTALRLFGPLNR